MGRTCTQSFLQNVINTLLAYTAGTIPVDRSLQVSARRSLHQEGVKSSQLASGTISTVTTFDELKSAWESGAEHIQLRAHLDATSFAPTKSTIHGAEFWYILPPHKSTTRSLTVRSSNSPLGKIPRA